MPAGAERLACRRQRHLEVGGGRKDDAALHPVVREPRDRLRAQLHVPEVRAVRDRLHVPAEQRMAGGRAVPALLRFFPPEAFPLPRVRRQPDRPSGGVDDLPSHGPAEVEERAEAAEHRRLLVFVAPQRWQHRAFLAEVPQRLLDRGQEDRMRAQLHEDRVAVGQQPLDGEREENRLAQVLHPVRGVEVEAAARLVDHGGVERHRSRARVHAGQQLEELAAERVHLGAVAGDGRGVHAPAEHAPGLELLDDLLEGGGVAGQDGRAGAVAHGDRDAVLVPGQRARGLLEQQLDRGHRPLAARLP